MHHPTTYTYEYCTVNKSIRGDRVSGVVFSPCDKRRKPSHHEEAAVKNEERRTSSSRITTTTTTTSSSLLFIDDDDGDAVTLLPCYMLYIYISICCYMRGTRFHLQSIIVLIIILRVSYITYLVHIHDRWIMATSFSAFHHLPRPTAGIIYAEI